MPKMNIPKFFDHKLDAKYFHVIQFFLKKAIFSEGTAKNCLGGGAFDQFLGKGSILLKKLI